METGTGRDCEMGGIGMITMDENLKIRHLMAAIEAMEGVNMPYSLNIKISGIHKQLKDLLGRETVV